MGKLLLGLLAALLVVFALADQWARSKAEDRAAERLEANLELRGDIEVSVGGWPFLWNAVRGNFPFVEVTARRVRARQLVLREVEIELRDVDAPASDILSGSEEAVTAGSGDGRAVLTSRSLTAVVDDRYPGLSLGLDAGEAFVATGGAEPSTEAEISLEGRELLIASASLPRPLRVPLPIFIEGLTYESVVVEGDAAVVRFSLPSAARLRSP